MTSTTNRNRWNQLHGTWTLSLGSRGHRVRLFENAKNGIYYRDVWVGGRKDRRSLKTRDRKEAERVGKQLLAELLKGQLHDQTGTLMLGVLWERYSRECAAWLDNGMQSRKEDERRATILIAFFGADRDVSTLSINDVLSFQKARALGGLTVSDGKATAAVRARTVQVDLKFLRAMLRWATTFQVGHGKRLLASNPLDGIRFPSERNERRPVATWERFTRTREAIAALKAESKSDSERHRWLRVDLALVVAEATGRRLNSIRQLKWSDVDFCTCEILWRADTDKKGREWTVPIPTAVRDELRSAQVRLHAITGFVFASSKDPTKPMTSDTFSWWLLIAEKHAGLPKLKQGLWHPYRRKWATERKELPMKDVMAAGGWSDAGTVLRSYQQADRATMIRVVNEPRKLSQAV